MISANGWAVSTIITMLCIGHVIVDVMSEMSSQLPHLSYGHTGANVTVASGQTAQLHCVINNLQDKAVSWIRKSDLHILTTDIFTYSSDARFQVSHAQDSHVWTLMMNDAQRSDTGVYECQVNTEPKVSLAFFVNVVAVFARIQGPEHVYATQQSILRLTCVVNMPPPKHTPPKQPPPLAPPLASEKSQPAPINNINSVVELCWLHDNKKLVASSWVTETSAEYVTSRLVVKMTTSRHAGTYTCHVRDAADAHVLVHVINDKHPAAMQHGNSGVGRTVGSAVGVVLVLFCVVVVVVLAD